VRTTLIDRLSATRLALVHRRIAEALEVRRPDDHDELAHHWIDAGDEGRATEHLRRAAERDLEALAYESAIERYQQVLDHHARRPPEDPVDEARAWLGLGLAKRAMGWPEYVEAIEEAGRRARRLGEADLMAEAAVASLWPGTFFTSVGETDVTLLEMSEDALEGLAEDDPRRVRVMSTMASHLTFDPDRSRRDGLLAEALALARASRDPELVGSVLVTEHLATWDPTTSARRAEITTELGRVARASGSGELHFFAGFFAALGAAERCDIAEARGLVAGLDDAIDRSRNFYFRFLADRLSISLDILTGQPGVQVRVDELAARYADTHADTDGTWALQTGGLAFQAGTLGTLVPAIRTVVATSVLGPIWRGPLGVALLQAGDRDGANEVLDSLAVPPLDYFWTTAMQSQAELALGLGRTDHYEALFDALAPYGGQLGVTASGTLLYGLVDTTLGLLAAGLGRTDEAIGLLEGARAQADAMGALFEGVKVRRALLGVVRDPDPAMAAHARRVAVEHGFTDELARLDAVSA
jgi:tetratricopeptide (TPR) repeat protein